MSGCVYVKSQYGAVGDGIADDTAAFNNALAAIAAAGSRGPMLVIEPGVYLIPGGITESIPGLCVVGIGSRCQGPGGQAGQVGVTLKATNAGAWVWKHLNPSSTANEYRGGRFEDITFMGNGATAGGLQLQTCYNVVNRCGSYGHTTGKGFHVKVPAAPVDSAAENMFHLCASQDDLIGFQIGDSAQHGSAESQLYGCINLKTTAGGIPRTGTGLLIWDNHSQVTGGKFESNNVGISVQCTPGVNIIGTRFEDNLTYDIDLNRASGTNGTRNIVIVATSKIRVGPFQVRDMVIGGDWQGPITNNGTGTVTLSNY